MFPAVLAGAEEAALWCSGRPSSSAQPAGACSEQAAQQGGDKLQVGSSPPGVCCLPSAAASVEGNGCREQVLVQIPAFSIP